MIFNYYVYKTNLLYKIKNLIIRWLSVLYLNQFISIKKSLKATEIIILKSISLSLITKISLKSTFINILLYIHDIIFPQFP